MSEGVKAPAVGTNAQAFAGAFFPGTTQKVTVSGTSAQSTAVGSSTRMVRICGKVACFVEIGANPTATATTSIFVPANVPVFLGCAPSDKIAAIQDTGGGDIFITEAVMLA